ncbi:MAG: hypothetical protein IJV36_04445 [Prevotella sp.]|nr:hypothetical protein [Prevotella sp.]
MEKSKNNFTRVIDWLRLNGKIKNQKEMAERMGITETTIARNKHGGVKRTDEETLRKFNAIFGDVINIAYLRGESDIMLVADLNKQNEININEDLCNCNNDRNNQGTTSQDIISMMNAVITAKDEIIATLRNQLADKDAIIESKERYINILQQQLIDLHNLK